MPHFERLFRATYHRPSYHYVLECRIERAKTLLREGKLSLHDVAWCCGFASQSHFTRHFTQMVGVTPARFVKNTKYDEIGKNDDGNRKDMNINSDYTEYNV